MSDAKRHDSRHSSKHDSRQNSKNNSRHDSRHNIDDSKHGSRHSSRHSSRHESKHESRTDSRGRENYKNDSRNSIHRSRYSSRHSSRDSTETSGYSSYDDEKYRKIAKKLAKSNTELKSSLRKLINEVESKEKQHHLEIQKTQAYYQKQLDELSEERDEALESIELLKETVVEGKIKIKECEAKLKEKNADKNTAVKNLENTIIILQDQLRNKNDEEKIYKQNSLKMVELERQLQESSRNLQNLQSTMKKEADQIIMQNRQLEMEKTNLILSLQNLQRKNEDLDKNRNSEILSMKQELEKYKSASEKKHNEFVHYGKKAIEDAKDDCDRKIAGIESKYKTELSETIEKYEKNIKTIQDENNHKNNLSAENMLREIEKHKKTIDSLRVLLDSSNNANTSLFAKKEENMKKTIDELFRKTTQQDQLVANLQLKIDKITGESEETIHNLQQQLATNKNDMKKMQENMQNINNHFTITLNKHKESAGKELLAKDQLIEQLDRQLKKIGGETVDQFNMMDRKLKEISHEYTNLMEKYNFTKSIAEKNEKIIDSIKTENERLRQSFEENEEKKRQLHFNQTLVEEKMKAELERRKLENKELQTKLDEYKSKHTNLVITTNQQQINLKNSLYTIEHYEKTIKQKSKEIENMIRDYAAVISELNKLKKSYPEELQMRITEVKKDMGNQITILEERLSTANTNITKLENSKSELQRQLNIVLGHKAKYEAIEQNYQERETQLNKINKHACTLEQTVKEKDLAIHHYELKLQNLIEKQKTDFEIIAGKNKEISDLTTKISMLNLAIERNKRNEDERMKLLEEKNRSLTELSGVKETQLKELNKKVQMLSSVLPNVDKTKRQIQQNIKNMREEYNKKISEYEIKLSAAEENRQKMEQYIKQKEHEFKNITPKLVAPAINKEKDELLIVLRQYKIELTKEKEINDGLEKIILQLNAEKNDILSSQNELKTSYINNLNAQEEKYKKELEKNRQIIEHLEKRISHSDTKPKNTNTTQMLRTRSVDRLNPLFSLVPIKEQKEETPTNPFS